MKAHGRHNERCERCHRATRDDGVRAVADDEHGQNSSSVDNDSDSSPGRQRRHCRDVARGAVRDTFACPERTEATITTTHDSGGGDRPANSHQRTDGSDSRWSHDASGVGKTMMKE